MSNPVRTALSALLGADLEPDQPTAECGFRDGFVGGIDMPCRDVRSRVVEFHCDIHGEQRREVCDIHELAVLDPTAVCGKCDAAGEYTPITFLRSGPVPAAETATSKEN